ncbi:MAG: hypothetical protein AAGJ79_01820 [Verrucomicrobiota bacterium]
MKHSLRSRNGFSLLEALFGIAVLSSVVSIAIVSLGGAKSSAERVALDSHVKMLNSAVKTYLAFGGSLNGVNTAGEALVKLKSRATDETGDQISGLRGSYVDARLRVEMQSESEASSSAPRALWDAANKRFIVSTGGASGIKKFVLGEPEERLEEEREVNLELARVSDWVWDYNDTPSTRAGGPDDVTTVSVIDPEISRDPLLPSSPLPLLPPVIELAGGDYLATEFPLSVPLRNPNPEGSSRIYFRLDEGDWMEYGDGPLSIHADAEVTAVCRTENPNRWTDSNSASESYGMEAVMPLVRLAFAKNAYNYVELGGQVIGASGPVPQVEPGMMYLANSEEIPPMLQSSSYMQPVFTTDGSAPLASPTAVPAPAFQGGFDGLPIPLSLSTFSSGSSVQFRGAIRSMDERYLFNSAEDVETISIETLRLRPPTMTSDSSNLAINLQTAQGDMPVGSFIAFTTDGEDPGVNGQSQPRNGAIYSGAIPFESFLPEVEIEEEDFYEDDGTNEPFLRYIRAGEGDLEIREVGLSRGSGDIVQTASVDGVTESTNDPINLEYIKVVEEDGQVVTLDEFNMSGVQIKNLEIEFWMLGVGAYENGNWTFPWESNFEDAVRNVLATHDIMDYMDYGFLFPDELTDHDFDLEFEYPLYNGDYVIVMERFGNTFFDLVPLGEDGEPIPDAKRLGFDAPYRWYTGYAPGAHSGQPIAFTVAKVDRFGINTAETPIRGFRVDNNGAADVKFFTMSSEPFETRDPEPEPEPVEVTIKARAYPPADLAKWFEPSDLIEYELVIEQD